MLNKKLLVKSILIISALILQGCGDDKKDASKETDDNTKLSFETIYHDIVKLPNNVQPWGPTWAPDGKHIAFNNIADGNLWLTNEDGSNPTCLTCNMDDVPKIPGAFSYIFPDNTRLFISNELGDKVFVLECLPNLYQCDNHLILPVDLSADSTNPQKFNVGRRTYHLAPDGNHLGYTMMRLDGSVMMVAELQRTNKGYSTVNHKVVNPVAQTNDPLKKWFYDGQLYELKGFADSGASILYVGQPESGNAETMKLNLKSGTVTRLTSNLEWDEDAAIAPNGQHLLVASWRTMPRLETFSMSPVQEPFFEYPLSAMLAIYYVSSFQGFQCDIQPWLLPVDGDRKATLIGQPLAPYKGGDILTANNLSSLSFWSPDSTRVLIQERLKDLPLENANDAIKQKGYSPNRLLIARIDQKPSITPVSVRSEVGSWASTPASYQGAFSSEPTSVTIPGSKNGNVTLNYNGNIINGAFTAQYNNYSTDGIVFLSGTVESKGGILTAINYIVDLKLSDKAGKIIGTKVGSLNLTQISPKPAEGQPPVRKEGNIVTTYQGKVAAPLPEVGPCYSALPKASNLIVKSQNKSNELLINVSANIYGDVRPVNNAVITINGVKMKTNREGNAVFIAKYIKFATL